MAARRRHATVADLLGKKLRTREFAINVPGEKGDQQLLVQLSAISAAAFDRLVAEHPPTKEQKDEGEVTNPDTFAPALISACSTEPKLTVDEAAGIWTSEDWSRGELRDLFRSCTDLCNQGLDVPFKFAG